MLQLHIKCNCGRNEFVPEQDADALPWLEDESLTCHCGKKLPYKGHGKIHNFGVAWASTDNTES